MKKIIFIDTEVDPESGRVLDYGAVNSSGDKLHTKSTDKFADFLAGNEYLCGHNIIAHDVKYIKKIVDDSGITRFIDTLFLSPLLFPNKPYHALVKDDKLQTEELNNPLNDSVKAASLFVDECTAFEKLSKNRKKIYYLLLHHFQEFHGFFLYCDFFANDDVETLILEEFDGILCTHANLKYMIHRYPMEFAYCLALISAQNQQSITPRWVQVHFPAVGHIMRLLRGTPCGSCSYCRREFNIYARLKGIFGYEQFREYNGEPLQEKAVAAAVQNKSLLAIFPTGGGKSLTFQLPALMAGETQRGLTVVISPLQSLMKDQVEHLERAGIAQAVTVNGLLSPLERTEAYERVESGLASILYISPESLRSRTIERILLSRNVVRFVIDEAHCFSSWGQDFRVDYLYIGEFIKEFQEKKQAAEPIPISCFTATAKQKVISDIKDYFKQKCGLNLELFATDAARTNLRYGVLYKETDEDKYTALRDLIEERNCPAIVYVSRVKKAEQLAQKLCGDGFSARAFHGKMTSSEKQENQDAFIHDNIQIMVATSAFGMGVDKANVGLVVHYDISDSLESYVQEAGRAGRDPSLSAECYVLFNDQDLDKHFILLNQTKLSISEIQQVWKAIKDLTRWRPVLRRSPLEIARQAGWDEEISDVETRVKTAVQALENAGYLKRGKNMPRVYATSILVPNMLRAADMIEHSSRFEEEDKMLAKRIISFLISSRSIARAGNDNAESRIDYISDRLGVEREKVVHSVQTMRGEGILADSKDLTAYIRRTDTKNKSMRILEKFIQMEEFLLSQLENGEQCFHIKELNERALEAGIKTTTVNAIKIIFYYWTIKHYIRKNIENSDSRISVTPEIKVENLQAKRKRCAEISRYIVRELFERSFQSKEEQGEFLVLFSVLDLKNGYEKEYHQKIQEREVEDALLYLSKIDAMRLEGGFLVLYNSLEIKRLELDNKIRYKVEDYRQLNEFYKQKIQQIHIVGEYANIMVQDYNEALQFVNDYFYMDYKKFLNRYFADERSNEINRNITPKKYKKLFEELSEAQRTIIQDQTSRYIVVAAGPGSGKTKLLVHKLASVLLLEDVKHEQLLMVTFSRAAATEFKQRLYQLIGNAAAFVEIKTFHSYCFDLIGRIGTLAEAKNVVKEAADKIRDGETEIGRITKTVLVIDEAQDMDQNEFSLVQALMEKNEEMRIIAVGDDDQNIYQFRGSDSKYLRILVEKYGAVQYELLENYRSCQTVVTIANAFAKTMEQRMKTHPILPVTKEPGVVRLIQHTEQNSNQNNHQNNHQSSHQKNSLETAVVYDLLEQASKKNFSKETICILTTTNQEALCVAGLLLKAGKQAKLIQSNDDFDLYNLAEIRFFLKKIAQGQKRQQDQAKQEQTEQDQAEQEQRQVFPVIEDSVWEEAKNAMVKNYKKSECLPLCLNLLESFEIANPRKYKTDFEMFLHESHLEDFYREEEGTIFVSTIHKSKGREFDDVYMVLAGNSKHTEEEKRTIYVGITRAKKELHIHYTQDYDYYFSKMEVQREHDQKMYPAPQEFIVPLSHKDVNLGFFKGKMNMIARLVSGMQLSVCSGGLILTVSGKEYQVVKFSKKCLETIQKICSTGYTPYKGHIRFVVAWKGKEEKEECAVLLPDLYFCR